MYPNILISKHVIRSVSIDYLYHMACKYCHSAKSP